MTATRTTTFGGAAPALHAQGWRPIPLNPSTKVPAESGWNRYNDEPWSERDLALAVIHHHDAACGIALPATNLALDLDVTEPSAASRLEALVDDLLGQTPLIRIGMPPKSVRLYRADGTIHSAKPHPIELYSGSGQVAVFGWHAKAGKPYTWPESSPLKIPADSEIMPMVSNQQCVEFLAKAEPILKNLRRAGGRTAAGLGKDAGAEFGRLLRSGVPFHIAARMVLEGAVDGGRHYAIRAVVSQGYNRGMEARTIERTILRAAPPELLEHVGDYPDRCLVDFAPQGGAWS